MTLHDGLSELWEWATHLAEQIGRWPAIVAQSVQAALGPVGKADCQDLLPSFSLAGLCPSPAELEPEPA